jgi:hypothetical protein
MVRTRIALGVAVMTAAAGVACGEDEGPSLLVDVRTDLRPGDEFAAVEVELRGAGTDRRASAPALTGHDFVAGRRVAELGGLPGDVTVHVALIDATGASVAQRSTEIVLREDTGITVVISRDCVDVRCPGPGDAPTHTQCHGGRCVDPRCHAGDFGACGAVECVSDAVCAEAADACGAAVCAAGACLFGPNEACVPDAGPADAGGRDASTICTGDVDCPEAEECGAMGRCVTSCAESRVDPYAGTPCTSATFECILMCSGQACIDACVDADAMGSECV